MKKNTLFLFLVLFTFHSHAQLTPKDFKLCLDDLGCNDSALKITKAQLLNASQLTPNFSWFTITGLTLYIGKDDLSTVQITGDKLNEAVRVLFRRAAPGTPVHIEATGHNKQGAQIAWGGLSLIVIE